ncbi:PIR protein [Plasmodium brasilianum]|uniref:PIR protein n=1 Tax=Plasmodium brasilianum TaxID=5824 RepID=UPI00350E499A|nr:PIR protein [Plasmodium brasilianum]
MFYGSTEEKSDNDRNNIENPGKKCTKIGDNCTSKYQVIDEKYNKNPNCFQEYKIFSSETENICIQELKIIPKEVLDKIKELYTYYRDFLKYNGTSSVYNTSYCDNIRKCYKLYKENYEIYQKKYMKTLFVKS